MVRNRRWIWAAGAFLASMAMLGARAAVQRHRLTVDLRTPRDLHRVAYVGSNACRNCHLDHLASWKRTFHRTMTAEATSPFVKGDFSGATLEAAGVRTRMDRAPDGRFQMTFQRPGEPARVATVDRTVGSHRYQQYLTRIGDSYWRLPVAWNVTDGRWFPMTSAFLFPDPEPGASGERPGRDPDDPRPVFGGGDFDRHVTRWNDNCVFCHNVAPNPARDPQTGRFETRVAELGVACEACHGPGGEHVARNSDPARRQRLADGAPDPTIVNPARLSAERAADLCGRCHGQRLADDVAPFLAHGDPFVPGDDLALESAPLWRDTALHGDRTAFAARFWEDGTARLTAYEYQGLLQSPCAMRGSLTCTSCHGMHEGDPRGQIRARLAAQPNGMCTGCHQALATQAAAAAHAHHDPGREGGRCVSCHMPRIVYGVLDVHRSHRIELPDPGRNAAAGRPDACTGCHVDRTAAWAQAAAGRWWGTDRYPDGGRIPAGTAPAEAIRSGEAVARAVAADALGRGALASADGRTRRLGLLLDAMAADRYPAVREIAWRAFRRLISGSPMVELADQAAYDPAAAGPERALAITKLLSATTGMHAPPLQPVRTVAARAPDQDLEIGE